MITPKNIMEDAWCYMKSRVLFTAAELDLFTKLDGCHYTAAELARDGSVDERGATGAWIAWRRWLCCRKSKADIG